MNFRDLIKRADDAEKTFEKLDLADAVEECLDLDDLPQLENDAILGETPLEKDDNAQIEGDASTQETTRRLTSHTQSRMVALQQASDQIQRDIHRQECEDLRAEIALVNARFRDLLSHERPRGVTNAFQTVRAARHVRRRISTAL